MIFRVEGLDPNNYSSLISSWAGVAADLTGLIREDLTDPVLPLNLVIMATFRTPLCPSSSQVECGGQNDDYGHQFPSRS